MPTNDNDPAAWGAMPPPSDSHGRAALLLVESLIHGLCEKATLSAGEAVEIAERAIDVQRDQAESGDGAEAAMQQAHALLLNVAASLRIDAPRGPPSPGPVR